MGDRERHMVRRILEAAVETLGEDEVRRLVEQVLQGARRRASRKRPQRLPKPDTRAHERAARYHTRHGTG